MSQGFIRDSFRLIGSHGILFFILSMAPAVLLATDTVFAQSDEPTTRLVVGQPVARELRQKEIHSYIVDLKAGQYINVLVQPQTIDVAVAAVDPSGKLVAEMNWEGIGSGESFWVLAESTGDYQLKVNAAARTWSDPRYVITLARIGDLETATHGDQSHLEAHRLFSKAAELRAQGGEQALRQAIETYEQSLPLWRAVKNGIGEAYTLLELGSLYDKFNEKSKEMEALNRALPIWRAAKNHQREEALTLYNLGSLYAYSGNSVEAIACYKKAIEIRRALEARSEEAFALTNLGQAYFNLGDFDAALESHRQALNLRRATGEIEGQARSLSNISGVYFALGDFQQALNYCQHALPLRRAAGDRRGEGATLTNIGSNYRELGEPQRALEYYQQALPLLSGVNQPGNEAALLDAIGRTYYDLGEHSKALGYHHRSLALRQKIGDRYGEGAALANIGNAYGRLKETKKALEYLEQSLELRRAIGDRRGEALTLQNAGELYRVTGDLSKALAYFQQGLDISRAIRNRFVEANVLFGIARTAQAAGNSNEALKSVEAAIEIIESTRTRVSSSDLRASLLASKHEFYELAIDLMMQAYQRDHIDENLIKAFNVSERKRARSLIDNLQTTHADVRRGAPPELLHRERLLRAKLNQEAERQIKLASGNPQPEEAPALSRKITDITSEYEQVLVEIRKTSERYAALTQPMPLSLAEVQSRVLDRDTLLIEYVLGTERSYVWAVTTEGITGFQLPARAELESLARNAYELMTARNRFVKFEKEETRQARIAKADIDYQKAGAELSRVLLAPALAASVKKRLLIVSDGALQYLSFAALPLPGVNDKSKQTPLIAKYEIVNLPSASTLGVLRRELAGRKPAPKMVAVLADPVFDKNDFRVRQTKETGKRASHAAQDAQQLAGAKKESRLTRALKDFGNTEADSVLPLPRLRFTRLEAEAIGALTPAHQRKKAIDFAANRLTAIDPQLGQYRYLHFATHGLLNNRHPQLSGIVLSQVDAEGREQDGFLLANDIYNLDLPAELVVLSGCKTGLGKEVKGEGILSLTRSFMYAGAARVIVSLWDVNDRSTAELMTEFYRGTLGRTKLSPAAALRDAQISMSKSDRWSAPYYWAAFTLQGEYRKPPR